MKTFLRRWGLLTAGVVGYWGFAIFHAVSAYNFISTHGEELAALAAREGFTIRSGADFQAQEASRIAIGTIGQYALVFALMIPIFLVIRWLLNASRHMPEERGRFH